MDVRTGNERDIKKKILLTAISDRKLWWGHDHPHLEWIRYIEKKLWSFTPSFIVPFDANIFHGL